MSNQPGLTLADIAAMSEEVQIGDLGTITVYGISAQKCLSIFKRFPKMLKLLAGFDTMTFIENAPDAVSAIIAAGTGKFDDAEAEAAAANIGIEYQYDILEAIGRLTFKSGFAPFVERIMKLAGTIQNSASSGRVTATTSQQALKPSSPQDTPQT